MDRRELCVRHRSRHISAAGVSSGRWARVWWKSNRPRGWRPEASSAAIILSSSAAGMALSTTTWPPGSILGSGVGQAGRGGALGCCRADGGGVAGHPAGGRSGGWSHVLGRSRHRSRHRAAGRQHRDLSRSWSRCPLHVVAPSSRRSITPTSTRTGTPPPTPVVPADSRGTGQSPRPRLAADDRRRSQVHYFESIAESWPSVWVGRRRPPCSRSDCGCIPPARGASGPTVRRIGRIRCCGRWALRCSWLFRR